MTATPAPTTPNIVLLGFRGAGKTSVGRLVAQDLSWKFTDTDDLIVADAGMSIRDIFARHGADDFRARETAAIRDAVTRDQQVISVGGGAVLLPENHELLSAAGVCVWLQAAPEALFGRIQADPASADNRPSLTDQDGLDEVRLLLEQRAPLYAACAQRVVDTNQKSPQEVASDVLAAVTCDRPFSG